MHGFLNPAVGWRRPRTGHRPSPPAGCTRCKPNHRRQRTEQHISKGDALVLRDAVQQDLGGADGGIPEIQEGQVHNEEVPWGMEPCAMAYHHDEGDVTQGCPQGW